MNLARPVAQFGEFIATTAGSRFRIVSEPSDHDVRGTVVFVHAFAEEMNKSRRMAALMARLLAGDGWRVVQRDLFGCGDSPGEFGEAKWADWVLDVDDELSRALSDRPVWLWCERAGALLAPAALSTRPNVNLLLWQPVTSGAQHLQQFLRLHAGARIVGASKASGGLSPIQTLRSGVAVEVGGYWIAPALAMGMEQASFDLPATFAGRVVWFEVTADEGREISPASERVVQGLSGQGIAVDCEVLRGPPFWQTQEIEECAALLERSQAVVTTGTSPGPRPTAQHAATHRANASAIAP